MLAVLMLSSCSRQNSTANAAALNAETVLVDLARQLSASRLSLKARLHLSACEMVQRCALTSRIRVLPILLLLEMLLPVRESQPHILVAGEALPVLLEEARDLAIILLMQRINRRLVHLCEMPHVRDEYC